ncbi:MAG: hypothetical protein U9N12_00365 [Euryarchaeota archaeon]|nr:hypothetical protein [Euryarchaeota archaeon]
MNKQRDILIERLEQKLMARDTTIAEMARSPSAPESGDRIAALEAQVRELKTDVHALLNELLYQKTILKELQQGDTTKHKEREINPSTEYIIAESTISAHSRHNRQSDVIVVE